MTNDYKTIRILPNELVAGGLRSFDLINIGLAPFNEIIVTNFSDQTIELTTNKITRTISPTSSERILDQDFNFINITNTSITPNNRLIEILYRTFKTIKAATTPIIYNLTCFVPNKEYTFILPDGIKQIILKARHGEVKMSFKKNENNYIEIENTPYKIDMIETSNLTLYYQSEHVNAVLEILAWI